VTEADLQQGIRSVERLIRSDPGMRGFPALVSRCDLKAAASDLLAGERVILVTGFCIRDALVGETDGPSGTLALAVALRSLGKDVTLVTDAYSRGLLDAGAAIYGAPFPTLCLTLPQAEADRQIAALIEAFAPTHVVAIERPGSSADGGLYSMRGERVDDLIAKADRLFAPDGRRDYRTIAIGDGGNELGFGSERDALKSEVAHGELIFCSTSADYLIPAGVSNWGAYALGAALSLSAGTLLIEAPDRELAVLEALVGVGAVDGVTKKNEVSVDGLSWDDYARPLAAIYEETRARLA
jgi:hypothetical protein